MQPSHPNLHSPMNKIVLRNQGNIFINCFFKLHIFDF